MVAVRCRLLISLSDTTKMASGKLVKSGVQGLKQVRPLLSLDKEEARKRVLNLYKAWYRQIPYIGKSIDLEVVSRGLATMAWLCILARIGMMLQGFN